MPHSSIQYLLSSALGILLVVSGCAKLPEEYSIQEGDILFQSLPQNPVVVAIEGVTQSDFSHCGIVVRREDDWHVLEAIGPVKETPLLDWIDQGRGNRFWAYRLEDALQPHIPRIIDSARTQKGKAYDILYRFDNEEIYCSELIFNAVKSTIGIELGEIETMGGLNWKPFERTIIGIQGYVPHDREMITPVSLSRAEELFLVYPLSK